MGGKQFDALTRLLQAADTRRGDWSVRRDAGPVRERGSGDWQTEEEVQEAPQEERVRRQEHLRPDRVLRRPRGVRLLRARGRGQPVLRQRVSKDRW